MATPIPSRKTVADIKANLLLKPALTSHFYVSIGFPGGGFKKFLSDQKVVFNTTGSVDLEKINLLCSEVSLPGSQFSTHEANNDFTGVTERFAYRRVYDDRVDLTFYVDADNYLPIRLFETWMKYIADESIAKGSKGVGSKDQNYYYRFRYPDGDNGYRTGTSLSVTKFERNYGSRLTYEFIKPYPISITSIPVSYDTSNLLKCTVSMTYIRYVVDGDKIPEGQPTSENTTPENQAIINNLIQAQQYREAEEGITPGSPGFGDPQLERAFQATRGNLANQQFDINGRPIIDIPVDINGRPIELF